MTSRDGIGTALLWVFTRVLFGARMLQTGRDMRDKIQGLGEIFVMDRGMFSPYLYRPSPEKAAKRSAGRARI